MENQKELIKFIEFVDKRTDWKINPDTTNYQVVQEYINLVDSAQEENSNVSDNEEEKEGCSICGKDRLVLVDGICFTCSVLKDLSKPD